MTNNVATMNRRDQNGSAGPGIYSPVRDLLGYDPFRRFFSSVDPGIEVVRTEGGFEVEIPVAGFTAEQIEIVMKDDILTLTGKSERRSFTRSLQLPDEIDPQTVEAAVANGLLTLSLKRHPSVEPRRIEIKAKN